MEQNKLKNRNGYLEKDFYYQHRHVNYDAMPYYQKGNETTTDIEEADKDDYGRPICLGHSAKKILRPKVQNLCLDPKDPVQRQRALESRASMNDLSLDPTIYQEKLDAVKYANDSANAMANRLQELSRQKPETKTE